MQDYPLTIPHMFHRVERLFPTKEIVTALPTGRQRLTYGEWADRTRRLGGVLDDLGISADGRVATFSWNTARHLELYFAAPCTGRVLHTLNLRLFPEQVTYIVNHAADEVIFVDKTVAGLLWPLLPTFTTVRHLVVIDDGGPFDTSAGVPDGIELHDYEELLAAAGAVEFHVADEGLAASMCYTSGTTGNPKGVVYSHRSTMLHTMATMFADGVGIRETDKVLPVVPMFHANAWGLAHSGVATGADLIMPGPDLSPKALAELIESERVTVAAGVPTIWMGVLPELAGRDTSALRIIPCGGSAVPKALSEGFREQVGLPIFQAWGMTETSPVATVGSIKSTVADLPRTSSPTLRAMQGLPLFGVELQVLSQETGEAVPWDGGYPRRAQAAGLDRKDLLQRPPLARELHRRRLAPHRRRGR
ncbi:MAG: AMP-binding protein [Acidimicrobiales bacterium]